MNDSIVCPDCSNGPDQCKCNNGIRIPKIKKIKIKIPKVKIIKRNFDSNTLMETVQQSFPFMSTMQTKN